MADKPREITIPPTETRRNPPKPRRAAAETLQTKKQRLIRMLKSKTGADVPTLSTKLGWQPHTTRAALSRLRKAGIDLSRDEAAGGKPARYRIVPQPDNAEST